jgi:hypothetical protein
VDPVPDALFFFLVVLEIEPGPLDLYWFQIFSRFLLFTTLEIDVLQPNGLPNTIGVEKRTSIAYSSLID